MAPIVSNSNLPEAIRPEESPASADPLTNKITLSLNSYDPVSARTELQLELKDTRPDSFSLSLQRIPSFSSPATSALELIRSTDTAENPNFIKITPSKQELEAQLAKAAVESAPANIQKQVHSENGILKETNESNDGKFSWKEAGRNFLSGLASIVRTAFEHPVKTAAIIATGVAAVVAAPATGVVLVAGGVALGAYQLGKAGYQFATAKDGDAKERAFYSVGEATSSIALAGVSSASALKGAGIAAEGGIVSNTVSAVKVAPASAVKVFEAVKNGEVQRNLTNFADKILKTAASVRGGKENTNTSEVAASQAHPPTSAENAAKTVTAVSILGKTPEEIIQQYGPSPIPIKDPAKTKGPELVSGTGRPYERIIWKIEKEKASGSFEGTPISEARPEVYFHSDVQGKYGNSWRVNARLYPGQSEVALIKPNPAEPKNIVKIGEREFEAVPKKEIWDKAKDAEIDNVATPAQLDMLKRGHYRPNDPDLSQ